MGLNTRRADIAKRELVLVELARRSLLNAKLWLLLGKRRGVHEGEGMRVHLDSIFYADVSAH